MPGFTATDPAVNGQEVFGGFLASHYHKPSDDLSLPMDLPAVERFTRANLAVARAIADDPVDPAWKPGNFFGKLFGPDTDSYGLRVTSYELGSERRVRHELATLPRAAVAN